MPPYAFSFILDDRIARIVLIEPERLFTEALGRLLFIHFVGEIAHRLINMFISQLIYGKLGSVICGLSNRSSLIFAIRAAGASQAIDAAFFIPSPLMSQGADTIF